MAAPEIPAGGAPPAPPGTAPASGTGQGPIKKEPLRFTGSGAEYFRIWIVNVCLTVLTLGIYSAWAKVRTNRYFYRNTKLAGQAFDYLANPVAILKGRLLVMGALVILGVLQTFQPLLQPVVSLTFFVALPWLIVRSMRFRLQNTSWRNIRFGFDGKYGEALGVYVGIPVAVMFTLGMLQPYAKWKQWKFLSGESRFGAERFRYKDGVKPFYGAYFKAFAMMMLMAIAAGVGAALLMQFANDMATTDMVATPAGETTPNTAGTLANFTSVGVVLGMYLGFFLAFAYLKARTTNLMWGGLTLGQHEFTCRLSARKLAWLYLSNLIAIVCTVGLAIPWAKVRMARYRVTAVTMHAGAELDHFVQGVQRNTSATGEEMGDLLDVDFGL